MERYEKVNNGNESLEIPRASVKAFFPRQQAYGFITGGTTHYIASNCPVIEKLQKHIELDIQFSEKVIPDEIALLAVYIEKESKTKKNLENWELVYDKYFKPNGYLNKIKIDNFFPHGDYRIKYGLFLKADSTQAYPRLYKKDCYFTVR